MLISASNIIMLLELNETNLEFLILLSFYSSLHNTFPMNIRSLPISPLKRRADSLFICDLKYIL